MREMPGCVLVDLRDLGICVKNYAILIANEFLIDVGSLGQAG